MAETEAKPRIALTAGDPAGIGPEIVGAAAADPRVREQCEPVIYDTGDHRRFPAGVLSGEAGRAAYDAVCAAVGDAMNGRVEAIATAPINKFAFASAGLSWKGHTDLLAHLTGARRSAMMFWSEPLKVVLATVHVPLAHVPDTLTRELLDDIIDLAATELPWFGVEAPRLVLAGLNPHAGEDGLLGSEETNVLVPAVAAARGRGVTIDGPFPADTLFVRASRGEFDAVIACYHDQGLIPVKLLAFGKAVNVTLGLPIIRTSVDHGTAFDIAGKGVADAGSMVEAVLLAARLARARRGMRPLDR
jgi:4-phospho-D-threonate 3-dehydrogenase / 4-phospho-D-erythronate 3-dehydrogenase